MPVVRTVEPLPGIAETATVFPFFAEGPVGSAVILPAKGPAINFGTAGMLTRLALVVRVFLLMLEAAEGLGMLGSVEVFFITLEAVKGLAVLVPTRSLVRTLEPA